MKTEKALQEANRTPLNRALRNFMRLILPTIFIALAFFIITVIYCQHVKIASQQAIIETQVFTIETLTLLSYSEKRMQHERIIEMSDDLDYLNRIYGKVINDNISLEFLRDDE